MANTLVIDTSFGSTVGVLGHEPIMETDSRTHVEKLQVNIGTAVGSAGLAPGELDRIVVGVGPAPFTGLRAGIVAAKAIAYATGAQLLGADILEPQAWMMKLKRQGDDRLADCGFLATTGKTAGEQHTRHLTLAVNDARRRQLYFALYADEENKTEGEHKKPESAVAGERPFVFTAVTMDIDYPQHIVERVLKATEGLDGVGAAGEYRIDIVGHGASKYDEAWQGFGESLGQVIDHSVLDAGAAGLQIFTDCTLASNGFDIAASNDAEAISDNGNKNGIRPVEPLYLRRPDVSVPNPLKHVLNHSGATKA